jgi:polysaccharide chain length determinant protein (PEP-CTERM system associated)
MREQIEQVLGYVQGLWRFRWYAAAMLWVIAIAGWAVSFQMPDQYKATAQVHVDTESMLQPLLRGLVVDPGTQRRVELMTRTLLSRPNLEKVARNTDLDLQAQTPAQMESLVDRLEQRISLSGAGRDNLYTISYVGDDPRMAHDIVDAVVSLLVEESMGESRQDTESAIEFLDRKVKEYEARLEAAEQRLMEFKRDHAGQMPGASGDYYERLQQRMEDLEQARFQLETAQSRQRELERQLEGETPVFGIMGQGAGGGAPSVETPELDARIRSLQEQLDQLLLKYTQQHPQVEALKDKMARLEEQRAEKREQLAAAAQESGASRQQASLAQNPVHQEIRASLAQARSEVAAARSQVEQYEQQVQELREKVNTIPEVEARLKQLNRNYETTKSTYEELLQRQQQAEISQEVERSDKQVDFRVVEPPRVPSDPVAPNRPMLVTASFGAAIAGSTGLGVFLSLVWPAFYTRGGLYSALQLPVLGAIGRVRTARQRRRRLLGLLGFAAVLCAAVVAYGVALLLALGTGPHGLLSAVQGVL